MMTKTILFQAQTFQQLNQLILYSEPNSVTGNYSNELKNILPKLLNKNPEERNTSEDILKEPFIINFLQNIQTDSLAQSFDQSQASPLSFGYSCCYSKNCEGIFFPFTSKKSTGILGYLSEVTISEFTNEISVKNMRQGNFIILQFLASCSEISLQPEQILFLGNQIFSFNFHSKSKKFSLK
jgi:serine/threonine protein kinase